ncbi:unnamed protein product, partial [Tetraodon nigroviridis]
MKSPVHRCRDVEHSRVQSGAGTNYLQAEQRIPISKDVITSSSASAMWFIKDACGIMCAVITWLLVFYAEFVVLFVMLLPSKNLIYTIVNGTLFNALAFLALASHLRAMCTDPGAVPKGNATKEYIESLQLKPGQMYIALISLHALVMVVFHFLYCFEDDWTKTACSRSASRGQCCRFCASTCSTSSCLHLLLPPTSSSLCLLSPECSSFSPPATVILLILLCFEGLLFLIFTSVMFGTQVHSICTDETGIEQLKKEERRWAKKTKWMNMRAVFGHPFSILWFSPFSTPDHGKAETYQYVV